MLASYFGPAIEPGVLWVATLVLIVQGNVPTREAGEAVRLFPSGLFPEGRASGGSYGRDTDEVVFVLWPEPGAEAMPKLMVSRRNGSEWSRPIEALREAGTFMVGPAVSPDGQLLYFESNQRAPEISERRDTDLWVATRQGEGWGEARPLGAPFDSRYNEHNVTASASGTICFNSSRPEGLGENDLYCATGKDGTWTTPANLGPPVNTEYVEGAAYLDPEERFLLFGSDRPGGYGGDDLYISIRRAGQWTAPVNLGPAINTAEGEWAPAVSPDGKRLLFTRITGTGARARFEHYEIAFNARWLHMDAAHPMSTGPGPRATHSLMYDPAFQRTVLLDGTWPAIQPQRTEVWTWDGKHWAIVPMSSGPLPRYTSAAVYDTRRNRVVSYGGRVGKDEAIQGDTWEWDGKRWQQMADSSIEARDHIAMAYDALRGQNVLFGGGIFPRRPGPWAMDTWIWDGVKWRRASTEGPTGRVTSMVYDEIRQEIVLFGGVGAPSGDGLQPNFHDTWIWNGTTWRKASEEGPPARDRHAMAFDRGAGVVLLYGGGTSERQFDDMWQWDGNQWKEIRLAGATPGRRSLHAMTYDPIRGVTVLYGGNLDGKVVGDTWEWDGKTWACKAGCAEQ